MSTKFPDFLKNPINRVPKSSQNTDGIEGYYYSGNDGSQVAFWESSSVRESQKHQHPFDEYMICISGQYTVFMADKEFVLNPGDDLVIPKNTEQFGKCIAGTRTIHFFGERRI